jgi:hypothetical protein
MSNRPPLWFQWLDDFPFSKSRQPKQALTRFLALIPFINSGVPATSSSFFSVLHPLICRSRLSAACLEACCSA